MRISMKQKAIKILLTSPIYLRLDKNDKEEALEYFLESLQKSSVQKSKSVVQ